jgi:hypothetical protein
MQLSAWRFWSVWGIVCGQICKGTMVESFTRTVLPRTLPWLCVSFWCTIQSPYLPDLAPCNFFLFPKCKLVLHGQHLCYMASITAELTTLLKGLKEGYFQGCFNKWKRRWDKCIASKGEYFEGDKNDILNNM